MTTREKIKEAVTVAVCALATLLLFAEMVWLAIMDNVPF